MAGEKLVNFWGSPKTFENCTYNMRITNLSDGCICSLRIAYMQAYAMRITIMERQRKKFEYENEVTTQIVGIRYFRKAATGTKFVGSPLCLQAITCNATRAKNQI